MKMATLFALIGAILVTIASLSGWVLSLVVDDYLESDLCQIVSGAFGWCNLFSRITLVIFFAVLLRKQK